MSAKKQKKQKQKKKVTENVTEVDDLLNEGDQATIGEIEILPADDEELDGKQAKSSKPSSKAKGLVPYDSFQAYLSEIRQYPKLSREEEYALAVRYYENQDIEAAYQLVSSNLWLVVKMARDYQKAARSVLDLVQEGNMGLMEAVKNFDPYKGVRFPSYAVWWIKAYIIRYVIANWRMVKIGTTQAQRKLFFQLQKEKEKLEQEGFFPAPKLLAERLEVRESDVIEMEQRLGSSDLSVDYPVESGSEANLHSILPDSAPTSEDLVAEKEIQSLIRDGFRDFEETLSERDRIIFRDRIITEKKITLQVLSDQLSISKERVRQVEEQILKKLKEFFLERYGEVLELPGINVDN